MHPNKKEENSILIDWKYMKHLFVKTFLKSLAICFSLFFISFIFYPFYKVITMPEKIEYCYLEEAGAGTNLSGFIPWHGDHRISWFASARDAKKFAEEINCPLNIGLK
jgi:hypothetical protein